MEPPAGKCSPETVKRGYESFAAAGCQDPTEMRQHESEMGGNVVQDGKGQSLSFNYRGGIPQHHSLGLSTVSDALRCTWG